MRQGSRRSFLFFSAAAALRPAQAQYEPSKTRLILLGTAGGPRPTASRVPSSQVVLAGGSAFVFDCGSPAP